MSYQIHVHHRDGEVTETHVSGDLPDGHHVISGHHGNDESSHNLHAARHNAEGHQVAETTGHRVTEHRATREGEHDTHFE